MVEYLQNQVIFHSADLIPAVSGQFQELRERHQIQTTKAFLSTSELSISMPDFFSRKIGP